jgi:hypothetical protein
VYNVYRWYEGRAGRYTGMDPILLLRPRGHYHYAGSSPLVYKDSDGREPKPAQGNWCGSNLASPELDQPCSDCNVQVAGNRLDQARRLGLRKCGDKHKDSVSYIPGTQAIAGIDWDNHGQAWYVPQGDRCVDYCLCAHETYHLRQVVGLVPLPTPRTANALECDAYTFEASCLSRLLGGTIRSRVPGL